jgi:AcrR family transcriptional regulator
VSGRYDIAMNEAEVLTLRERKKDQTRLDLAKAALQLFVKQGFDETTIEQIVDRANCSRRTFFRHYASKEDVAFGDLPQRLPAVMATLSKGGPAPDPIGVVRNALIDFIVSFLASGNDVAIDLFHREPALQRRYMELAVEWEQAIAEYLESHPTHPADGRIEAEIEAIALVGVARAIVRARVTRPTEVIVALNHGFDLVADGLVRRPPGEARQFGARRA